jgi:hypothetical protein
VIDITEIGRGFQPLKGVKPYFLYSRKSGNMKTKFHTKQLTLLLKHQEFKNLNERNNWIRSLSLEDQAILRHAVPSEPKSKPKLF